MALSIVTRPLAQRILDGVVTPSGDNTIVYITNTTGFATVFYPAHAYLTGYGFYAKTRVEDYNGFWYAEYNDANTFFMRRCPTCPRQTVIVELFDADASHIYSASPDIKWFAAHLPIVYKLSNTKWPVNTDDTVRTISTCADSGGFSALTLSGDIKASGSANKFEFIKLTNTSAGGLFDNFDGIYQIVAYTNETTFTISLPYDNTVDLSITGASIQYYYNNYNVSVNIWAGLNEGHVFEGIQPYAIAATVGIVPDENNEVIFSVNEIIKANLKLKNNLLLSTIPNNLDFMTMFYIEYAEVYDVGGSSLTTLAASYTSDIGSFEGFSVNAKLPFKNIYSGAMSAYINNTDEQKFLTLFDRPTIFQGKYFDISFLSQYYNNFANPTLNQYVNEGSGISWALGTTPSVTLADGQSSKLLTARFNRLLKSGVTYRLGYSLTYTGVSTTVLVMGSGTTPTEFANQHQAFLANGSNIGTMSLTPTNDTYFNLQVVDVVGAGGGTYTLNAYWFYPLDDTGSFNEIVMRQNGVDTVVKSHDEGLYRQKLTDPSCTQTQVSITLFRSNLIPLVTPAEWSNFSAGTAFDTKNYSTFTEAVTTVSTSPAVAFMSFPTLNGETVRLTVPITVTGTAVFTSGIRIVVVLTTTLGATTSTSATQTITANGSFVLNCSLVASADGARILVQCIRDGISSGTANVTITIPVLASRQKMDAISETKTIDIDCNCESGDRYLSWLDPTGGFNYWFFNTKKERGINILSTGATRKNIFPTYPESYGEYADSIDVQTFRVSKNTERIFTNSLTDAQAEALAYIKTSPLVQIVNSIYDRRTVIVDENSFVFLKEIDKLRTLEFNIEYTDEIASQTI